MELILVVVGAIVITAVAHRRGLEPALIIVVVGIAVSFVPGFEAPELDSHILLSVVLPPLLYSAALDFSFPTFLRNIKPILGLGVGLVVVTAFTVAAVSSWLVVVPLTFATALILGSIVAPPDAVTAVAVGRKLGLPKRVMSILTGESLINDAAALALFSVAVAQVAGSHTFIENPLLLFTYSAVLGPVVGAVLGYVTLWIRRRLANPALETVQGLMVPFGAFILAEEMHASGVLRWWCRFVVGSGTVDAGYQTRLQERYVWNSVDVLLEAFVFAYIGLHLRFVLEDLREAHESLAEVAVASLIVLLIVLVIRPLSVFLRSAGGCVTSGREAIERADPAGRRPRGIGYPAPSQGAGEVAIPVETRAELAGERLGRLDGHAWVVKLAAAAAIPVTTAAGEPFPERATIQAIAFVVSVGTLLIQGWTLPLLIKRLHLSRFSDDHAADREEELKTERVVHDAADEVLAEFRANPPEGLDPRVLAEIRNTIARHSQDADEMPDPEAHTLRAEIFAGLYRDVLSAQRAALISEQDTGRIDDEAVRAMLERLDLQEAGVSARLESRF